MENVNEERSLVKVDNGIFARMRRFFHNIFSRKNKQQDVENYNVEKVNDNKVKDNFEEEPAQPKLFNFDDPQNYYGSDEANTQDNAEQNTELSSNDINENKEENTQSVLSQDEVNTETELNPAFQPEKREYVGISKYFEDVDDNYIGKSKKQAKPEREDGYEEKEELEQKLMNYYASIKKVMQQ